MNYLFIIIVIRHETTAAARWALLLIVRTLFNDAIAVALWTGFGFHVCLPVDVLRKPNPRGLLLCNLMPDPISLASRNNLARSSQASRAPPWGISQPAFISRVCKGANKVTAFQSNFQGFLLNPRVRFRRAGIHSGGS